MLYYDFYVLQKLADMNNKRVYGASISDNRHYRPRYIYDKKIKAKFTNKVVGIVDAICGELDNMPLHVFGMK